MAESQSQSHSRGVAHRTLMPKPAQNDIQPHSRSEYLKASHTRSRLSRNLYTGCHVPSCATQNCSSYIHHQLPWLVLSKTVGISDVFEHTNRLVTPDHGLAAPTAVPNGMAGDFEFNELFHQYLTYDMPRIVALMAPPSSTQLPGKFIMSRTKAIAELGSSAQVYFLLFVSMAHILELVRREQLEAERISAKLYARLTRLLREKLQVYQTSEVPHLILAILAMSSFDMSLGNHDAVCCHRTALAHLVSQVGLSYLGHSTTLVLSYDRLMSVFTYNPPLYAKMLDRSLLRQRTEPRRHGLALEELGQKLDLDGDVCTACLDLCEAIEIVEAQDWTFRPERQYSPYAASEVQYLYFLREVVQNSCINLHARDLQNPQVSRAVLFAVMIIQYVILGKNELTWYSTTTANRLYRILSAQDLNEGWYAHRNLLCWLICVLILVPKPWKLREEALNWAATWFEANMHIRREELDRSIINDLCNLRTYIWCEPELSIMLDVALKDIQSG